MQNSHLHPGETMIYHTETLEDMATLRSFKKIGNLFRVDAKRPFKDTNEKRYRRWRTAKSLFNEVLRKNNYVRKEERVP